MTLALGLPRQTPAAMVLLISAMTSGPVRLRTRATVGIVGSTIAVTTGGVLTFANRKDPAQSGNFLEDIGERIRYPLAHFGRAGTHHVEAPQRTDLSNARDS